MKFSANYKRISSIIPLLNTENEYTVVHDHLLRRPTRTEYLIASRIAKTIDSSSDDPTDNPLVRQQLRNKSKWMNNLIIHYVHEARLTHFKKYIHQLWDQTFKETPVTNTKLIVGNRNSANATRTLIRQRPRHHLSGTNIEHHTLHETEIV